MSQTTFSFPEAPEGWSGPHTKSYLWRCALNETGTPITKKFKSFEEAVETAEENTSCYGITLTSQGYTLRIGVHDDIDYKAFKEGKEMRNFTPRLFPAQNPEKANTALASWIIR